MSQFSKAIVVAIVFGLSFQNLSVLSQPPKGAKMECKLIVANKNVAVGETPPAEVEIKNVSKEDLIITYNTNPLEFLDLEVFDPAGKRISEGKYGGRFSPSSPTPQRQVILKPGEAFRKPVGVFGNSKENDRTTPGVYRVVAVFEYAKMRAVAEAVMLNVQAK